MEKPINIAGTGKTATVKEVIRTLKEQVQDPEDDMPEFDFIEINGKLKIYFSVVVSMLKVATY